MVTLALTPDRRWSASAAQLVSSAATAGFAALGAGGDRADAETAALYRDAGLRCHEVLALVIEEDTATTISSAERLAEGAQAMGADWVLTIFRTPLDADARSTISRCAQVLAEAGSAMAVEFSPFGPITSIPKGLEVVSLGNRAGGRAGLMIDTWHFFHGDSTWEDLAQVPLDTIAYVQFADALRPESDDAMHETMNRRALPGAGRLELDRFATTLLDRGWDGIVSLEVLSSELQDPPIAETLARLYRSATPFWD